MITLRKVKRNTGVIWQEAFNIAVPSSLNYLDIPNAYCHCILPTGRIIISGSSGVWYSNNNGAHWTKVPNLNIPWQCLCVTPTGRVIAGSNGSGLWYSDDNGETWTQSDRTNRSWSALCVTPTGRIITCHNAGYGIMYSDDNGETWIYSDKTGGSWRSLCVTPTGRILAGSADAGIWCSDDNGINWNLLDAFGNRTCYSICVDNTDNIFVALGGNGGVKYSSDNGATWSSIFSWYNWYNLCCTSNNIIFVRSDNNMGIWKINLSEPHIATRLTGATLNWNSNDVNYLGMFNNDRLCAIDTTFMYHSDPLIETEYASKYLDQNGAQEIVTQFKAYCDSLVGGA